jgi:hypothetical protein
MSQKKLQISVSPNHAKSGESLILTGTGFTPNRLAMSHLLRPDGTEYNPLRVRINDRGEISHRIDTTMLEHGSYEIWLEDEASNTVSNRIAFTVEPE